MGFFVCLFFKTILSIALGFLGLTDGCKIVDLKFYVPFFLNRTVKFYQY